MLHLAGVEFIFFTVATTGLCFGFCAVNSADNTGVLLLSQAGLAQSFSYHLTSEQAGGGGGGRKRKMFEVMVFAFPCSPGGG